jgi:tetratricopeptide (TPR) repeat protein
VTLAILSLSLSVLLLAGTAEGVQVDNSDQNGQTPVSPPGDSATPPGPSEAPTTPKPEITVTGKVPHTEGPLPALPPDEFTDCMREGGSLELDRLRDPGALTHLAICASKLDWERRVVLEMCINRSGKSAPPRVIQACTESLDHKILQGSERFVLFVNRAEAYFAQGDKQRALDDYNQAVRLAPHNAKLYCNRGVFYAAQTDGDAALRDFDTALGIDPKLVPALHERAKLYQTQGNFTLALADYSEAIRLQPKTATLWSERGYVYLLQRDYENAVKDEAQAIRLDPKLARAYFFRGAAFGGLGHSPDARSDIVTAVRLDPSLERYLTRKDKSASVTQPP